ncbi:hypothetical protein U1Q18_042264 [Sarracenia purpurea var. burkii]
MQIKKPCAEKHRELNPKLYLMATFVEAFWQCISFNTVEGLLGHGCSVFELAKTEVDKLQHSGRVFLNMDVQSLKLYLMTRFMEALQQWISFNTVEGFLGHDVQCLNWLKPKWISFNTDHGCSVFELAQA